MRPLPQQTKDPVMYQEAIRVTRENISDIASTLNDGTTAQDILNECDYMLTRSINVVFGRDIHEGFISFSYVVSESVFHSNNATTSPINDTHFVRIS